MQSRKDEARRRLLVVGVIAASLSGVAILLAAVGWISMAISIAALAPLTAVLFVLLYVVARRTGERTFLDRLAGGLIAGVFGLIAYDVLRLGILVTGLTPFNPFRPIEVFGLMILDRYQDSILTQTVGWIFHVWNGLGFAVMYTLAVGPGTVVRALLWAMLLELAMLASYPSLFRIALEWPFVTVSLVGHVAYGVAVGLVARRVVSS